MGATPLSEAIVINCNEPGEETQLDTRGKNCVISTISQADAEFAPTIK